VNHVIVPKALSDDTAPAATGERKQNAGELKLNRKAIRQA
jgi:hypothetical protein